MSRPKKSKYLNSKGAIKIRAIVAHEDYDASVSSTTIEYLTQDPYFLAKNLKKLMSDTYVVSDQEVLRCIVRSTFKEVVVR